ncbi:MAG: hypothetical protein F7B18_01820 [Desulfurococcales archaeon]|nr:hypothetical protein [Desulfurococcales archaeon]
MGLPKKTLAVLLIIIALTASLESMPRYLVASIAVPAPASGPTNESPYGTSRLVELASLMGYNVSIVYGPESLRALEAREVGVVLVAPYNTPEDYVERLDEVLGELRRARIVTYVLVADEFNETANAVVEALHSDLCPFAPEPMLGGLMVQDSVKAVFYTGGHGVIEATTGRTSYIKVQGVDPARGLKPPAPVVRPGPVTTWGVYAYAWPAGDPLPPLSWYPLAYKCQSIRGGGISLVADSTLLINKMLDDNRTRILAGEILRTSFGDPRDGLVIVFDQEPYLDPTLRADIRLRFHPSFILTTAASIYASLESQLLQVAAQHYPTLMAIALLAGLLTLTTLPPWLRGAQPRRVKRRRRGKPEARVKADGEPSYCEVLERLAREGRVDRDTLLEARCRLARAPLGPLKRLLGDPEEEAFRRLVEAGWSPLEEALG